MKRMTESYEIVLSDDQYTKLNDYYKVCQLPRNKTKDRLSRELGLETEVVSHWFKIMRDQMKFTGKKLEKSKRKMSKDVLAILANIKNETTANGPSNVDENTFAISISPETNVHQYAPEKCDEEVIRYGDYETISNIDDGSLTTTSDKEQHGNGEHFTSSSHNIITQKLQNRNKISIELKTITVKNKIRRIKAKSFIKHTRNGRGDVSDEIMVKDKKKSGRRNNVMKDEQLETLEKYYDECKKPHKSVQKKLSEELGLDMNKIKLWFVKRRYKEKRINELNGESFIKGSSEDTDENSGKAEEKSDHPRTVSKREKLVKLENYYVKYKKPNKLEKIKLSKEIGLDRKKIATWFQNKRYNDKRIIKKSFIKLIKSSNADKEKVETKSERRRTVFKDEQLQTKLEKYFDECKTPDQSILHKICEELGFDVDVIRAWFGNRRLKEKRITVKSVIEGSSDISDEDNEDDGEKSQHKRNVLNVADFDKLENFYEKCQFPDKHKISKLYKEMGMDIRTVKLWFRYRRAKDIINGICPKKSANKRNNDFLDNDDELVIPSKRVKENTSEVEYDVGEKRDNLI